MEKVVVVKKDKGSVVSVVISVVSVMISMASAAGQLVTKKGDASGISEQIGVAIIAGGIYLFHQVRNWIKKRNAAKATGIEFTHYIDMRVKHAANGMFKDYKFMRSFVIHFHNGEFTDAGLSLIKMTIKHEVTESRTVKKMTENYQGKPIPEMFYSMIRRVIMEGHYLIIDRDKIENNIPLVEWMEVYDVGSMVCVEIRDSKTRKIVALFVMQWRIKEGFNAKQIPQMKEDKKAIEDIYDNI